EGGRQAGSRRPARWAARRRGGPWRARAPSALVGSLVVVSFYGEGARWAAPAEGRAGAAVVGGAPLLAGAPLLTGAGTGAPGTRVTTTRASSSSRRAVATCFWPTSVPSWSRVTS